MLRKLLLILSAGMAVIIVTILVTPHDDVGSYIRTNTPVILIAGSVTGMVGGWVYGRERGRPVIGVLLGALMSWLGWVVLACIPPREEAGAEPAE